MKILERSRKKLSSYLIEKEIKDTVRKRAVKNLDNAENIGILFDATLFENFEIVKKFLTELNEKNKTVLALGFVDDEKIADHLLIRKGFNFFCKKDLNWLFQPTPDFVLGFCKKEFDIIMDLTPGNLFPLKYIMLKSKARLKVGKFTGIDTPCDISINTGKNHNMNFLLEQVKYYLTSVNSHKS